MQEVSVPRRTPIETVPSLIVAPVPIDTNAPKRLILTKFSNTYSTLSPKKGTGDQSTIYQTIVHSQQSTVDRHHPFLDCNFQQEDMTGSKFIGRGRPMTMHTVRERASNSNNRTLDKNVQDEEKRAATCHTRKRKNLIEKEKGRLVKIKEESSLQLFE
jgi:hypothetical protein